MSYIHLIPTVNLPNPWADQALHLVLIVLSFNHKAYVSNACISRVYRHFFLKSMLIPINFLIKQDFEKAVGSFRISAYPERRRNYEIEMA